MAYDLSFGPEFFIGPHDLEGIDFSAVERPHTVYQAVSTMSDDDWRRMTEEVFDDHTAGRSVTVEMVMEKIRETNTCRNLSSPVEVYIDEGGYHSVLVHETPEEER